MYNDVQISVLRAVCIPCCCYHKPLSIFLFIPRFSLSPFNLRVHVQAEKDDECFGQVAAIMTMAMTMGQILMGLSAGSAMVFFGSISRVFMIAACFVLALQAVIVGIDMKSWAFDERVALGLSIRRHQRKLRQKQVMESLEQTRRRKEYLLNQQRTASDMNFYD